MKKQLCHKVFNVCTFNFSVPYDFFSSGLVWQKIIVGFTWIFQHIQYLFWWAKLRHIKRSQTRKPPDISKAWLSDTFVLRNPRSSFTFLNLRFSYRLRHFLILISMLFPMTPFVLLYIMNFSLSLSSFLPCNPYAYTALMSWNILSGGGRSQSYHFNLISIKKIISLLLGLTAANGFWLS